MKCENCIALRDDSGYERDATECWCAVGEEDIEFADGSIGCKRRSIQKLKRDIDIQNRIENEAYVKECEKFIDWMEGQRGE